MEPPSVQESFAQLYSRSDLGVVMATESLIFDANDAALRMLGFTRIEMQEGRIDWKAMTPPEFAAIDRLGLEQLREYGVTVPFEKEYILRDGSRLPLMTSAVRLAENPLTWAAYLVNLRENRRLASVEQSARDLKAKTLLVNQLAHELNNPLAGLTFIVHLLGTRQDVITDDTRKLLATAHELVERISATVQHVLVATGNNGN